MRRWAHEITCCFGRNRIFPNWRYYRINKRILIQNSPGRVPGLFYCIYTAHLHARQTSGAGPENHTICIIKPGELPGFFMPRQRSPGLLFGIFAPSQRAIRAIFSAFFSSKAHIRPQKTSAQEGARKPGATLHIDNYSHFPLAR